MVLKFNSYAALLERARPFLVEAASRGPVLVLAQVRIAADDLARSCQLPATRGIYRQTLSDLIVTLSDRKMNERGLTPLSRLSAEAIAAQVAASTRGLLSYLAPVSNTPGFARALAKTLNDLRLNGATPETVVRIGRSGPCLAHLLEAWEQELRMRSLADTALRASIAMEVLASGEHELCGLSLLCVDVRAASVADGRLLAKLHDCAAASLSLHLRSRAEDRTPDAHHGTCLANLQGNLLDGPRTSQRERDNTVELFSASGEALECTEIVRRVLARSRAGRRLDETAVLLRAGSRYQPLLEEAFSRANIPVWFSSGIKRPAVAGRAFLSLLHCRAEGLSAARFAEYLAPGVVPREQDEDRFIRRWERLLVRAGITGGRDRWESRLAGSIAEREPLLDSPDEQERGRALRDVADLERLSGFALPIIAALDELPDAQTSRDWNWGDWIEALSAIARRTLNTPEMVLETLDSLSPMADLGPVVIDDVVAMLGPQLTTLRTADDSGRYGKVFVGNIEEAAGLSFGAVFLPGVNEGLFPSSVREDPLLLDVQRAQLGIGGSEDDSLLLRTAVACAADTLTASWSRIDLATGRERVPSFYAFEIAESAWGGDIDPESFEREARARTETRLGWPAPSSPDSAIDDAEYDLAHLRPHWQAETPGAGAWLKLANPHAHRALLARWFRWERTWKWSDGLVAQDSDLEAAVLLEQKFSPKHRAWKTTDLEEYARCPYRFLLKGIYKLKPAQTFEGIQRIDPAVRGTLFHATQEGLLTALREHKLLPVTPDTLREAFAILDQILRRNAHEMKQRLAPAIEAVWDIDIARLSADLRGWLRFAALNDNAWTPEYFEFEFRDIQLFDTWLLTGRIDMIETAADGRLRITDHKTGRVPEKKERPELIGHGEVLQPVLYALAAEETLARPVSISRLFYATIRNSYTAIPIAITPEARTSARNVFAIVDNALHDGFLPAAPREGACESCDYLPVCGPYEERRVERKSKQDIRALLVLRSTA